MFKHIKGDIFGGITAAVIALPLALAFGVASGAGAVAGLYGAVALGFMASLFGGTPSQISGPTGPMTVVVASAVVIFNNDVSAVMGVVCLTGIFQIVFGFCKIGKYVRYIPYPVISGFMSGIGMIIMILQINPFLGVAGFGSVPATLAHLPQTLSGMNMQALMIAGVTLGIVFLWPKKLTRIIPSPLVALVLVTWLSIALNLDIRTIGDIPATLPEIRIPGFDPSRLRQIVTLGFTLALLGSIDTLLTSLVADSITRTRHNPNRELIGQGVGNTLAAFIGGIPGAGATMRTVVNIKSGGQTRLSGMLHAVFLLAIMLFFAPLASRIPLALLAGILMKVGIDILDYKFLKIIKNVPKNDLIIMITVFVLTVFVDLIMAVGVGIVLASLLIVHRISRQADVQLSYHKDHDTHLENREIRVLDIDGAFFFGSAAIFEDKVHQILDTRCLVINCLNVPFMDISAIFALQEMVLKLTAGQVETRLVVDKTHLENILRVDKDGVFDRNSFYPSLEQAVRSISVP